MEQLSGGITGVWNTTAWWYYWCVEYNCLVVLLVCGIQLSGGITGAWNTAVWKLMGTANWCISTEDTLEQPSGGITGILGLLRGVTVKLTEIFCGCGVK